MQGNAYIWVGYTFVIGLAYFLFLKMAPRLNWYDEPNERSSHRRTTLQGAGVVFLLAIVTAYFSGNLQGWPAIGILFAGLVGLAADHAVMPPIHRLVLYAIAWVLVFTGLRFFDLPVWWVLPAFMGCLAWINFFNFMDGINGMMTLYAGVALATFWLMSPFLLEWKPFIAMVAVVVLGYAMLNVRKQALAFAGDIGSVSLAFMLAILMLTLIGQTNQWGYLLFFGIYFVDAGFTLLFRVLAKENLFEPHRKHLYQLLANDIQVPHIRVSIIYALLQAAINLLVLRLEVLQWLTLPVIAVIAGILAIVYLLVRFKIRQMIQNQKNQQSFFHSKQSI